MNKMPPAFGSRLMTINKVYIWVKIAGHATGLATSPSNIPDGLAKRTYTIVG